MSALNPIRERCGVRSPFLALAVALALTLALSVPVTGVAMAAGSATTNPAPTAASAPPPGDCAAAGPAAAGPRFPAARRVDRRPDDPAIGLPAYRVPVAYPETGTTITRITDRPAGDTATRVFKHDYARRAAWNADGSRLMLIRPYPAQLLDGTTYRPIARHGTPSDPIWSNRDPDLIFGLTDGDALVRYSVATERMTVVRRFAGYDSLSIGGGEGVQSDDDRYLVLLGSRRGGVDLIVHDLVDGTTAVKPFPGLTGPNGDIDWAGVSPSGRFVVVKVDRGRFDRGFDVYDLRTLTRQRRLLPGSQAHADLGYDDQGDEVLVTSDTASTAIVSVRLRDGRKREQLSARVATHNLHVSCRNVRRPGWCYVSTYPETSGFDAYLYRGIFALPLDGSGRVERFAPAFFAQSPADLGYERQAWAALTGPRCGK